jgi:hypothetical protein
MLPLVTIERSDFGDQGVFGRLYAPAGFRRYTGELPDRDNAPNVSCILPGKYDAEWTYSPAFKRFMYVLLGTAPRTGIREHSANFMGDKTKGYYCQLNGCIAVGERLGWMDGQKALLLSAPAVREFEVHMQQKPFELEIVHA